MKRFLILISIFICATVLFQCAGNAAQSSPAQKLAASQKDQLDITQLGVGTDINAAGSLLMDLPSGLNEIDMDPNGNDSVLVIAVHGYESQGYEWVMGLKGLVDRFGSAWFYRYDWEKCPDLIAADLAERVNQKTKAGDFDRVIIFGHSYGGVVLAFAASQLSHKIPTEVHLIAAPLSGFPKLLDHCNSLSYDKGDKLLYPTWDSKIQVIQHKTVHAQDGAFRDLASDPQDIDLPFAQIEELPSTMDGHRLGHNWSVTWVLDRYLGRPHRH